jgi:hypothetical protein
MKNDSADRVAAGWEAAREEPLAEEKELTLAKGHQFAPPVWC